MVAGWRQGIPTKGTEKDPEVTTSDTSVSGVDGCKFFVLYAYYFRILLYYLQKCFT